MGCATMAASWCSRGSAASECRERSAVPWRRKGSSSRRCCGSDEERRCGGAWEQRPGGCCALRRVTDRCLPFLFPSLFLSFFLPFLSPFDRILHRPDLSPLRMSILLSLASPYLFSPFLSRSLQSFVLRYSLSLLSSLSPPLVLSPVSVTSSRRSLSLFFLSLDRPSLLRVWSRQGEPSLHSHSIRICIVHTNTDSQSHSLSSVCGLVKPIHRPVVFCSSVRPSDRSAFRD